MSSTRAIAGPESAKFDSQAESLVHEAIADLDRLAEVGTTGVATSAKMLSRDLKELSALARQGSIGPSNAVRQRAQKLSQDYVQAEIDLGRAIRSAC